MSGYRRRTEYFLLSLEQLYDYPLELVEEIEPGWLWHLRTPLGEACLKVYRKANEAYTSAEASLHLHQRGFNATPRVLPSKDGSSVVRPALGGPSWWAVLWEWVPDSETCAARETGADLVQVAQVLASFHAAIREFRDWPVRASPQNWLLSWERIEDLTDLLSTAISTEDRLPIATRMLEGLDRYSQRLGTAKDRAHSSRDWYEAVIAAERARRAHRHGDVHEGNFLIGPSGPRLIDLAEIDPGPRIERDVGNLAWAFSATDEDVHEAFCVYNEIAPLSRAELEVLEIANDPVRNWAALLEGYLSGDSTEEMILAYYDGSVRDPDAISHRLHIAADATRSMVT